MVKKENIVYCLEQDLNFLSSDITKIRIDEHCILINCKINYQLIK